MNLDLTKEECHLLIDALEIYRTFLAEQAEAELADDSDADEDGFAPIADEVDPDFTLLENRAKTLVIRLETIDQKKTDPTPLVQALTDFANKEQ